MLDEQDGDDMGYRKTGDAVLFFGEVEILKWKGRFLILQGETWKFSQ
jgi:hypothetical protein